MKKLLLILLAILLAGLVAFGIYGLVSYHGVTGEVVPKVGMDAFGHRLEPVDYQWNEPVLGGLVMKEFAGVAESENNQLGTMAAPASPGLAFPEGYEVFLSLTRDGTVVYAAGAAGWDDALVVAPGSYRLEAVCEKAAAANGGHGHFAFACTFEVAEAPEPEPPAPAIPDEPQFEPGRTELEQGDIFAMQVLYLPEGVTPTATTPLGGAIFTPVENGWFAAVGIGNIRAPGEYPVQVQAGEWAWTATVTVLPFDFDEQNLEIDLSDPDISEANSPKAIQEYNDVMIPMYQTYDEERYWEGLFIQPTKGEISTQFGEIRYTNGDYANPSRHWGMDIAAPGGTEIIAPNNGRVVFADYLLAVGWTIIIEHGGGLKSYYYHMSEIVAEEGQMVEKGELIGKVGTTGYSTGNHLHFEMRLGGREQVISPSMLFSQEAGLYSVGTNFGED